MRYFAGKLSVATTLVALCVSNVVASDIYLISPSQIMQLDVDTLVSTTNTSPISLFNAAGGAVGVPYVTSGVTLYAYDFGANTVTSIGGFVPGNAMGGAGGNMYAGDVTDLYSVATTTGTSTYIGGGSFGYAGDLAGVGSTLFGAVASGGGSSLVTVNPATGAQSTVASYSFTLWGLASTADGRLFGGTPGGDVYELSTTTGAATYLTTVTGLTSVYDMASEVIPVPEPSTASISLFAAAAVASLIRRRRVW